MDRVVNEEPGSEERQRDLGEKRGEAARYSVVFAAFIPTV